MKPEGNGHGLRLYTTPWCPDCRRAKAFLRERGIEFAEINIEETPGAAELVMEKNQGRRKVPTFEVDGRYFDCSPFDAGRLKRALGLE